jgi:cytochrome b561
MQSQPPEQGQIQSGTGAEPQAEPPMALPVPPPSPSAMPVPKPVTSQPPSTVASLDAVPKDARKKATIAMLWFIISGIIFIAIGSYLYAILNDALTHEKPVDANALWSFIGVLYVFGALAIILAMITQVRVLNSMKADKWDTAVDTMMFLAIPGFIFGLALSGVLLYTANKKMRAHPFYLRTLPPPTPVCERCRQPVQWMPQMKKWYCPNCKIYL